MVKPPYHYLEILYGDSEPEYMNEIEKKVTL